MYRIAIVLIALATVTGIGAAETPKNFELDGNSLKVPHKPVGNNKTPEGRAANRRTMFINAAIKARAIGGQPVDGGGVVAGDPCK